MKIGDFGLARDIDNDSNYVVRGNVRDMFPPSLGRHAGFVSHTLWATCLCCLPGAFAREVDGAREHLSGDVHDEERRLGLRCSAVGDLLTW